MHSRCWFYTVARINSLHLLTYNSLFINPKTITIMFLATICGHLGAAAEVKVQDGRTFTTFRVAVSRRFQRDGQDTEETQWFSCILSGDGGELTKYLVKGQQVMVVGNASTRIYSSPKLRRMVASVDINVRDIELIGRPTTDLVPRRIAAPDGVLLDVSKFYAILPDAAAHYVGDNPSVTMYDDRGNAYDVVKGGWVMPVQAPAAEDTPNSSESDAQEPVDAATEEQP